MANLPEKKSSKIWRIILSFVLFLLIVLSSLTACSKAVILNKSKIVSAFTDYKYVTAVRDSVFQYTSDIYQMNGLDGESLDEILNYDFIKDSVKAYISNNIGYGAGYNDSTYSEPIDSICNALENDISKQITEKKLKNNAESVKNISKSVNDYLVNEIDISFSKAKTVINIGSIVFIIVLCVSLFFTASIGLILFFIGSKRYRSIRAVGISFYTAGIFEILLSLIACMIFKIKHIDIFPVYLRELVMNYIYNSIGSVAVTGCFLLLMAIIISVVVWKVRREN